MTLNHFYKLIKSFFFTLQAHLNSVIFKNPFFVKKTLNDHIFLLCKELQNENSFLFKKLYEHLEKNKLKIKTIHDLDCEIKRWLLTYLWYNNMISMNHINLLLKKRKSSRITLNYAEENKNDKIKALSLYGKINEFLEEREYRKEAEKLKDQEYEALKKKITDQSLLEIIKYDRLKELGMERVLKFPGLAYSQFRPYAFGRQYRPGDFEFLKPIGRSGPLFLISTVKADLKRYREEKRRIAKKVEKTYLLETLISDDLYPIYSWFLHFEDPKWTTIHHWMYDDNRKQYKWFRRFDLVSWCSNPALTYNRLLIFKTVFFYKKLFRRKNKKKINELRKILDESKKKDNKKRTKILERRIRNSFKFPRDTFIVHTRQMKAPKEIAPQPTIRRNKYKSKTIIKSRKAYPLFLKSGLLRGTFWKYWAPTVASKEFIDDPETGITRGEEWWRGTHYLATIIRRISYIKKFKAHAKNLGTYIYYKNWKRKAMDIFLEFPATKKAVIRRNYDKNQFWRAYRTELDVFSPLNQRVYDSEFALVRRKIRSVSRWNSEVIAENVYNNFRKTPSSLQKKKPLLASEFSIFSNKFNKLPNYLKTFNYIKSKDKWAYAWVPRKRLYSEDNLYKPRFSQYNSFFPGGYRYMFTTLTLIKRLYILYTYLLVYFVLIPFIKFYGYILRTVGLDGLFDSYYYLTRETGFRYLVSYKYDNFYGIFYPLVYGFFVWYFINLLRVNFWGIKWWWARYFEIHGYFWVHAWILAPLIHAVFGVHWVRDVVTVYVTELFYLGPIRTLDLMLYYFGYFRQIMSLVFLYFISDIYFYIKSRVVRIKRNVNKWSKQLAARTLKTKQEAVKFSNLLPNSDSSSLFEKKVLEISPDKFKAWKNYQYWNINLKGILWDETDELNYISIWDKFKIYFSTFLKGYPKYGNHFLLNNEFSRIGYLNKKRYIWLKHLNKSLYRAEYTKRKAKVFSKIVEDPNSEAYKKKIKEKKLALRISLSPKQKLNRFFNKELRDVITLDKQQHQYLKLLIKSTNLFFCRKHRKEKRLRFKFLKTLLKFQPINLFTWTGLLNNQLPGYFFDYFYFNQLFYQVDPKNKFLELKDPFLERELIKIINDSKVDDCLFLILIWELPKNEWLVWLNNYLETCYSIRILFRSLRKGNEDIKKYAKKYKVKRPKTKRERKLKELEERRDIPVFFSSLETNNKNYLKFLPFFFFLPTDKQYTFFGLVVDLLNQFN